VVYFAKYIYLPRVKNAQVILEAIQDKVARLTWKQDTFRMRGFLRRSGRTLSRS
jgi:hypothetical protein